MSFTPEHAVCGTCEVAWFLVTDLPPVTRFETSAGTRLYRITVPAFPHLKVHAFQVVAGPPEQPTYSAIVDTGSSEQASRVALQRGLELIQRQFGENVNGQSLSRIVLTHAHPDHAGALPAMRRFTRAPTAAHALDAPIIERPQDYRDLNGHVVEDYLRWSGIPDGPYADRLRKRSTNLMLPSGVPVDTVLQDGDLLDGLLEVIHTPGHTAGQVCLRVDDLLLTADHVLPLNSPPLMSTRFHPGGGLGPYLASLDKIQALEGVRLALGSHDQEMHDWKGRIHNLRERYRQKLNAMREAAQEPRTLYELNALTNPRMNDRQAILLLDQTAALIEYLLGTGALVETQGANGHLFQATGSGAA